MNVWEEEKDYIGSLGSERVDGFTALPFLPTRKGVSLLENEDIG